MITFLLIYTAFLTLFTISLIYYYEDKVKYLKHNLNSMTRRFHVVKAVVRGLDDDNEVLKASVKALKEELATSDGAYWSRMYHEAIKGGKTQEIHYEYSTHKDNTWAKDIYGDKPYVNPWNNTKGDK